MHHELSAAPTQQQALQPHSSSLMPYRQASVLALCALCVQACCVVSSMSWLSCSHMCLVFTRWALPAEALCFMSPHDKDRDLSGCASAAVWHSLVVAFRNHHKLTWHVGECNMPTHACHVQDVGRVVCPLQAGAGVASSSRAHDIAPLLDPGECVFQSHTRRCSTERLAAAVACMSCGSGAMSCIINEMQP